MEIFWLQTEPFSVSQIKLFPLPVGLDFMLLFYEKQNQFLKYCMLHVPRWQTSFNTVASLYVDCLVFYILNIMRIFISLNQVTLIHCYRYESFDFHAECRHLRWDRLSMLTDRLAHEQDEFGYFLLTRDGTLVSQQDGVFRTNCMDCLDRTNVVQSMLARRSLTQIMQVCYVIMKVVKICLLC
jgi:hypothetical protein